MRRGRLGRSIRTGDFRYTEWRNKQKQIVARELYDHRNDHKNGYLEKENVAAQKEFAEVKARLARQLHQLVPHNKK